MHPQGQVPLPLDSLPHHPTAEAASSLEFLHPTGWTLAAAVRNELSTPGQGTQASAALLSLPTPALPCPLLPCPRAGCASCSWQGLGGLPGPLKHHPRPLANLAGPARVGGGDQSQLQSPTSQSGKGPQSSAPDLLPQLMMQKPPKEAGHLAKVTQGARADLPSLC